MKKTMALLFGLVFLLSAIPTLAAEVHFQWGASTGVVDGYRIYHGDSSGGPYSRQLCEVNGTTLNCPASLSENQEYFLVCRAFNGYGESGDSNEVRWLYAPPGCPEKFLWTINLSQSISIQCTSME